MSIFKSRNNSLSSDEQLSFENLAKFASSKDNYEKMNMPDEFQRIFNFYSENEKKDID